MCLLQNISDDLFLIFSKTKTNSRNDYFSKIVCETI